MSKTVSNDTNPPNIYVYIYYYTPLPLNLAHKQASNKQQQASKQALLLSVLAIAPPHRSGLYSTLAILEPRWCPCQIQVFSKKPPVAPRGTGATSGGALPKLRILCPKTAFFGPKQPRNSLKTAKRRQTVPTVHVRLTCSVTKSPFLPSSSTICPRNGPKMAKNGLNVRCLCQTGLKPRTGRILGYVAQKQVPRARSPPATPHFLWFPSLRIAQRAT